MKITKEQFEEYLRCQELGYYNMFDWTSWSRITTLTKEQWVDIMTNYTYYKKKFKI